MALKIWTHGVITSIEEVKATTPGKKDRLKAKIAFNSKDRNSYTEPTFWLNASAWDDTAKTIKEAFEAGNKFMKMFIAIYTDSYVDKKTNETKYSTNSTIFKVEPFEKEIINDIEEESNNSNQTLGEIIESASNQ